MLKLYYKLPNGNHFAHISRSGTSTLAAHVLKNFYPEKYQQFLKQKEIKYQAPQQFLEEYWSNRLPPNCVCMLRDPVIRLKSMLNKRPRMAEYVDFVGGINTVVAKTTRNTSRKLDIVTIIHLAQFTSIADNDSNIILFPNIEQACKELGMEYYQDICENTSDDNYDMDVPKRWLKYLEESIGLYNAFIINKTIS